MRLKLKLMPAICYGAPNLYFLFAAMSLFNVCDSGEMVYIIPRSWTSGMYFKRFRQYLFSHGVIEQIHLFTSRDKVFDTEQVLQETMIVKIRKQRQVLRIYWSLLLNLIVISVIYSRFHCLIRL